MLVKTMAKLRMAHASTHGARKPPGPKLDTKFLLLISLWVIHLGPTSLGNHCKVGMGVT